MMRFILALLFLALAFVLQFWFATLGVFVNFVFAALVAFAFLFDIWDVLFFLLAAIFIINWQPALSPELLIFAAVTVAAYLAHRYSKWEPWAASLAFIVLGLFTLYLAVAPRFLVADFGSFVIDVAGCLMFGGIVFGVLNRRAHRD
ncbi:MAG TPA: hypothetical protein VMT99_00550 [Candidatus Paceibacterota bacterium]|nr:hypothetical protein [Candidatus Paceibacterota bacterium]